MAGGSKIKISALAILVILIVGVLAVALSQKNQEINKFVSDEIKTSSGEMTSIQASTLGIPPVGDQDHIRGTGRLTWIEYSDLECPFCKAIHPDLKKIVQEYDGKLQWVYRHFPVSSSHPKAAKEAEAAECAAELGGNDTFWKYIDRIFEVTPSNNRLNLKVLSDIASEVGLDKKQFQQCLDSGKYANTIANSYEQAVQAGIGNTPSSFLLDDKGNAWVIIGDQSYSNIKQIVETALGSN